MLNDLLLKDLNYCYFPFPRHLLKARGSMVHFGIDMVKLGPRKCNFCYLRKEKEAFGIYSPRIVFESFYKQDKK